MGDLFGLLSQAHMLDILYVLIPAPGPVRFVELQSRLHMSPNTLSARLKSLVKAGLASRTAYQEIPPRVDYAATAKARDLESVFQALSLWAGRHSLAPLAAP
ncbi:MAG: winged helix-turn-helix transcriptional regulator [Thermoplasmatota archaeon]